MQTLLWITASTLAIALVSWAGLVALALREELLSRVLLLLVAFSAGSLLGGAFFHLLPEAFESMGTGVAASAWFLAGFSLFLLLEQFVHWHHCHRVPSEHAQPVTYLILVADGLHNFIGGLAIGGSYFAGFEVGLMTTVAAASHEIPQELGDFGILVHGGWEKWRALVFNFASALTIVPGGILVYLASASFDVTFLLPFAAGNFAYIAASDLIPEIKGRDSLSQGLTYFVFFLAGVLLLLAPKMMVP